jgi:hypothetical protein
MHVFRFSTSLSEGVTLSYTPEVICSEMKILLILTCTFLAVLLVTARLITLLRRILLRWNFFAAKQLPNPVFSCMISGALEGKYRVIYFQLRYDVFKYYIIFNIAKFLEFFTSFGLR